MDNKKTGAILAAVIGAVGGIIAATTGAIITSNAGSRGPTAAREPSSTNPPGASTTISPGASTTTTTSRQLVDLHVFHNPNPNDEATKGSATVAGQIVANALLLPTAAGTELFVVDLGGKYSTLVLTIGASPAGGPGSEAVLIDIRSDNSSTPYFSDRVLERNAPLHVGPITVKGAQTLKITVSERVYDEAVIAGTVTS